MSLKILKTFCSSLLLSYMKVWIPVGRRAQKRRVLVVWIYKSIARMILAQKSSPVPSSRRSSPAPLPRRGCLVLPVPRRSPEPSPAPRSRAEPPPALGRVEQLDLIHRLSIETKFQFQFKRESRVQGPQLILNIQNPPGTGVRVLVLVLSCHENI